MTISTTHPLSRTILTSFIVLAMMLLLSRLAFSQTAPALGTAVSFGVLANGAITGTTVVTGNVGTSTSDAIAASVTVESGYTKFAPAAGNVVTAHNDFITAYNALISQNPGGTTLPATFGSETPLTSGIYIITSPATMTTDLTLDGPGIFIFKTATALNTTAGTVVHLTGGAQWTNIFWQVDGAVTLGAGSSVFEGTILCNSAITVGSPVTMHGRLLGNDAITLSTATVGSADIPFPVELVSFTATAARTGVSLNWTTATERNNYGFVIERSATVLHKQNAVWTDIGFVNGNGTSAAAHSYAYADKNLSAGNYSYRLRQTDRDGEFVYSGTVDGTIASLPLTTALMQNFPNPFNPTTVIQYQLDQPAQVTLSVFDLIGGEVATLVQERQAAGSYSVPFTAFSGANPLASGIYLYRLKAGSFVATKKLTLLK